MMEKEKFLGEFEQFILLAIVKLADDAYGSTIRQLLEKTIAREVTIGALYTTLDRLEKKGLVESHQGEATAVRGGRAKKHFIVTAQGIQALKRSKQALNNMWQDIALNEFNQPLSSGFCCGF
ncbi:PadR family transcriptional regulator [Pseudoalteromonas tunicata]|jgi:DNA-binding PadR family transcriptional regulator|nr:PadR family transcriptional regulator [Pseudoalteromonas tunicata]AXT31480.1 PadR family transcriptional regulator [Pseudoalteromonas tunicata]